MRRVRPSFQYYNWISVIVFVSQIHFMKGDMLIFAAGSEIGYLNLTDHDDVGAITTRLPQGQIYDIEYDPIDRVVFWSNYVADGGIWRVKYDGTGMTRVYSDAFVYEIALDVRKRKIYWTQHSYAIWRSNLDGSGKEAVITTTYAIMSFSLDVQTSRLSWVHGDQRTLTSGSNSDDTQYLFTTSANVIDLETTATGQMFCVTMNGTHFSIERILPEYKMILTLPKHQMIRGVAPAESGDVLYYRHLNYIHKLDPDNPVRSAPLYGPSTERITAFVLISDSMMNSSPANRQQKGLLFYGLRDTIGYLNLTDRSRDQNFVIQDSSNRVTSYAVYAIDYDPIGNYIYWTVPQTGIYRMKLDGSGETLIQQGDVRSIYLDVSCRYMYWLQDDGDVIHRRHLDTEVTDVAGNIDYEARARWLTMGIDNRIYWLRSDHHAIYSANPDATDVKSIPAPTDFIFVIEFDKVRKLLYIVYKNSTHYFVDSVDKEGRNKKGVFGYSQQYPIRNIAPSQIDDDVYLAYEHSIYQSTFSEKSVSNKLFDSDESPALNAIKLVQDFEVACSCNVPCDRRLEPAVGVTTEAPGPGPIAGTTPPSVSSTATSAPNDTSGTGSITTIIIIVCVVVALIVTIIIVVVIIMVRRNRRRPPDPGPFEGTENQAYSSSNAVGNMALIGGHLPEAIPMSNLRQDEDIYETIDDEVTDAPI